MTTTISGVNAGSTAASESISQKSKLSNETKSKLAALGISEASGMTESEAQAKIAQAQQQQSAQNQNDNKQDNSSESEILSEAKSLASAVGISVSSNDDVSEILNQISNEIEEMLEEAEGNPAILPQLSSYLSQLTNLDDRYDSLQASQSSMYNAMNMVSTNNKIALGLS